MAMRSGRLQIRLYHSALDLGRVSIIQQDLTGGFTFLGRYQPYTVYIPDDVEEPPPVLISLSGNTGNHVGDQFVGSAVDSLKVLENLNNLPVRMVGAGIDPSVTFDSTLRGWQAFDELGRF